MHSAVSFATPSLGGRQLVMRRPVSRNLLLGGTNASISIQTIHSAAT